MRKPITIWTRIKKYIIEHEFRIVFCLFIPITVLIVWQIWSKTIPSLSLVKHLNTTNIPFNPNYLAILDKHRKETLFPYRYLKDDQDRTIPIVLLSGFFRDDKSRDMYQEYIQNGVKVVGITAYKTFPKKITDPSEDRYHWTDGFDYTRNIQNWLCCMRNPGQYGFTAEHNLVDISESDFYDVDDQVVEKKYDLIYVCLNDQDAPDKPCALDAWNAVNRNFKLALECFPIMIQDYGFKILIMGRTTCGLEEKYGENIETIDFLPYHEFQDKLRQSRMLFVPNIYDASPRVVAESIVKGLPILMNREIVCGSKYITEETGELFTDQHDIRGALDALLSKMHHMYPKKWWAEHYGTKVAGRRLRDFLAECYPEIIGQDVQEIHF